MDKPTIAILLPYLRGGGAEHVGLHLANEFVRRGLAVDMVLTHAQGELIGMLDACVQLVDLDVPRVRNVLRLLVGYLRRRRPEGLIANMWPLSIIAPGAKRLARVTTRVIAVEHTTWSATKHAPSQPLPRRMRWSMWLGFRLADDLVVVSSGVADDVAQLANVSRNCVRVLHNPISGAFHNEHDGQRDTLTPTGWAYGHHKKVLVLGALKAIKDFPTLLRAFASARQQMDAKLLILGEGGQRPHLEALVRDLGLEDAVFMPGFSNYPTPYFAHADLHVLSSTGEGFGNVIVEALEQGTPVVSTDCRSGPNEILDNGRYGTLVPVGDQDALAAAMLQSLQATHDHDVLRART